MRRCKFGASCCRLRNAAEAFKARLSFHFNAVKTASLENLNRDTLVYTGNLTEHVRDLICQNES